MEKNFVLRLRGNWKWVKFYFSNKLSQKKKNPTFQESQLVWSTGTAGTTGLAYWYYRSVLQALLVWSTGTTGTIGPSVLPVHWCCWSTALIYWSTSTTSLPVWSTGATHLVPVGRCLMGTRPFMGYL